MEKNRKWKKRAESGGAGEDKPGLATAESATQAHGGNSESTDTNADDSTF